MEELYLDWGFDEDEKQNYKFEVERSSHNFKIGDRVKLTRGVSSQKILHYGSIIHISNDSITVHTDTPIDISEAYSIEIVGI